MMVAISIFALLLEMKSSHSDQAREVSTDLDQPAVFQCDPEAKKYHPEFFH
jgi:hypothetical protein